MTPEPTLNGPYTRPENAELHTGPTAADPAVAGGCRFCRIIAADDDSLSIWSNTYVAAFEDAYPSAPGHMLIVPTRHVQYARDLCREEWVALMEMVHDLLIDEGDATVGINDGPAAGQTVPHLHVHVIPRSVGDVTDPRGGVRWVIPSTAAYWSPA